MADDITDRVPGPTSPTDISVSNEDLARYAERDRQRANYNFFTAMDKDPEEAARAAELSRDSGVPTEFINADVKGFEKQHRAALSTDIIQRNERLKSYFTDSTAAQISHDDVGQLDRSSESLDKLQEKSGLKQWLDRIQPVHTTPADTAKPFAFGESFMRGFGEDPLKEENLERMKSGLRPDEVEWASSHPVTGAIYGAVGQVSGLVEVEKELLSRGFQGLQSMGYEGMAAIFGEPFAKAMSGMLEMEMQRGDIGVRGLGGDLQTRAGVRAKILEAGLTPERQAAMMEEAEKAGVPRPPGEPQTPETRAEQINKTIAENADALKGYLHGVQVVDVFTGAGEEPPPHIDPLLDKAKEAQVREDLDRLKQAVSDADQTNTKARSQDHFARFAAMRGDGEIGISIDKLRELYPEGKLPEEGDGLLGWVPGLAERMENADLYDGDIYVPRSEFLAKTEREVVNRIGDGLRLRDGGITIDESKIGTEPKQVIAEPVTAVRGGAGLEPLSMAGDRKVTLQRETLDEAKGIHDVGIMDERGNKVGNIKIVEQNGGKRLLIQMIEAGPEGVEGYEPNYLGPTLIRDVGRQLKEVFPKAFGKDGEGITGYRVSGARAKAGVVSQDMAPTTVKFQLGEDPQAFRDLLQPYWEKITANVGALKAGFTPETAAVRDAVLSELQRITPTAEAEVVTALHFPKAGGAVAGLFVPSTAKMFVSLERMAGAGELATQALGTARHEAIHFLRRSGLIKDAEWATLEGQAKEWRERFGIDKRYKNFSEEVRNEEAVAEAYRYWRRGEDLLKDPAVFERIKEFMARVLERVQQALGMEKEATWEDVFKAIDKGEVGRRKAEAAEGEPLAMMPPGEDEGIQAEVESRQFADWVRGSRRAADKEAYGNMLKHEPDVKVLLNGKDPAGVWSAVETWEEREPPILKMKEDRAETLIRQMEKLEQSLGPEGEYAEAKIQRRGKFEAKRRAVREQYQQLREMAGLEPIGKGFDDPEFGWRFLGEDKDFPAYAVLNSADVKRLMELSKKDADFSLTARPASEIAKEVYREMGGTQDIEPLAMAAPTGDLGREVPSEREKQLVKRRNDEDHETTLRQATAKAARREAPEVKNRLDQIKREATQDLRSHPALQADRMLTEQRFKIDPKFLTDEQKQRLPKDYQAKGGVNPADTAPLLGFTSGDALVERVAMMTEQRNRLGLSQKDYFKKVRDAEVDRRFHTEFGDTQRETLEEARDQAFSDTQMQLTHEETRQGAVRAGIDHKLALDNMKAMAKKVLDEIPLREIKSSRYMQKAGAIALKIAEARAKGQNGKVYRMLIQRELLQHMAKMAREYEKKREFFDKTGRFFSRKPSEAIAERYDIPTFNWIQHTFARLGFAVDTEALGQRVAASKEPKTFNEFVDWKQGTAARDFYVPEWVRDPTWPGSKTVNDLTHAEFEDIHRMVTAMETAAKDEKFFVDQGKKIELDEAFEDMRKQVEGIEALGKKEFDPSRPYKGRKTAKGLGWSLILPEFMWDRLDQGNVRGIFHRLLIYPAARMIDAEVAMTRKYVKRFQEIKKGFVDMDRPIENTLFKNPLTGSDLPMRRRNALAVLAYWGNESNKAKLMQGYGLKDPAAVEAFLRRNTTRADWDTMQKIGDVFEELFVEGNKMSKETTGADIPRVKVEPFTDIHGVPRRGWYSPIDYEKEFNHTEKSLEQPGHYRATTDQRWTMERTGKIGPVALNLEGIEQRLGQIIHDITIRPTAIQMHKILFDPRFEDMMRKAMGSRDQLVEMQRWLQDAVNRRNTLSEAQQHYDNVLGLVRANTISNLVGYNFGTILKHGTTALVNSLMGVGPLNFLKATHELFRTDPATQARLMHTAYNESDLLKTRMHNYTDLLRGEGQSFKFEQGTLGWIRELNIKIGALPVSLADFASVMPTYWAARQRAIAQGASLPEAIDIGNKAVRDTHGTATLTGQAGIMRNSSQMGRMYTSLYGFFNHMLNNQYKLAWKARDLLNGQKPQDIETQFAWTGHMLPKFMTYFIIPAVVEELVSPYTNEEKDSWGMKVAKGLSLYLGGTLPHVRDFVRGVINLEEKGGSMLETAMQFPKNLSQDLSGHITPEKAARAVKDAAATAGELGLPFGQAGGRVLEYAERYRQGLERPKGPWDVAVGLRYGTTKKHSHSFAEWWSHTVEGKR